MRFWERFSLPLFSKELIEQSNRRRTFVIRTVYAGLFYAFMLWMLWNQLGGWESDSLSMLGRGREVFSTLVSMQFFAIYLFLPGLTCGALAAEKERDTLAMLLLTKLGPWTILLEKLLSRLMPLGLLLFLSLPLLAVAYGLGGVESWNLFSAAWILGLTAFQVGAFSLFCSAWFRTTAGAFVGTYVLGFCLLIAPAILAEAGIPPFNFLAHVTSFFLGGHGTYGASLLIGFGPFVFAIVNMNVGQFAMFAGTSFWARLVSLGLGTSGLWLSALLFLAATRIVLWRRAFVQPKRRLLKLFHWLDQGFHRLNRNPVTKGIVLINESVTLPQDDPIFWRETRKKALGTTRYLIRFLLVVMPPLLFYLLLQDSRMYDSQSPGVIPYILLWLILVLAITVQSAGLIAGEKSRQTLDVLLSTPLTSEEIIRQKTAGVRKLIVVMCIPLATVIAYEIWWRLTIGRDAPSTEQVTQSLISIVTRTTSMIVYPAIIVWIGFHLGLRLRNQGQALLATLGIIVAVCVIPWMLYGALQVDAAPAMRLPPPAGWASFSPILYIVEPLQNEFWYFWDGRQSFTINSSHHWLYQIIMFVTHFGFYGMVWYGLRRLAYRDFARLVRRNDQLDKTSDDPVTSSFPDAGLPVEDAVMTSVPSEVGR
ncbi:MAG: ABC transporter permease subunit [Planctomycetaceae bacterium]